MKFLILIDDSRKAPERAFVEMEAQGRWLDAARKKGQVEALYSLAGNHGATMIVNVKDHDALDELLMSTTVACAGVELKIYPLCEYDAAMKRLATTFKRNLGQLKAAKES